MDLVANQEDNRPNHSKEFAEPARVHELPVAPARHLLPALLVSVTGIALSILTWTRALEERQLGLAHVLGSLADGTTVAIESQLDREVNALREMATFWQLHGVLPSGAWHFHTRWTLEQFPGIQWIAWVPRDSTESRFVARDSSVHVDSELWRRMRQRLAEPSTVIEERWSDGYYVDLLLPVGSPSEGVNMLAAAIRVDSLWLKSLALTPSFGVSMTSDRGNELALRSAGARTTPSWVKLRRGFTSPGGHPVQVDIVPSPEYVQQIATP